MTKKTRRKNSNYRLKEKVREKVKEKVKDRVIIECPLY